MIVILVFTLFLFSVQPVGSAQDNPIYYKNSKKESNSSHNNIDAQLGTRACSDTKAIDVDIPVTTGPTLFSFTFRSDSYSIDPHDQFVRWLWDFGDGENSTEADTTHSYKKEGIFQASFTAWNTTGAKQSISNLTITVFDRGECSKLNLIREGVANRPIKMSYGSIDPDTNIVSYHWDFGDGSELKSKNDSKVEHVYSIPVAYTSSKTFTVTVRVIDNNGKSNVTSSSIKISASDFKGPEIKFGRVGGGSSLKYIFRLQLNDHKENMTAYHWDLGDGNTSNENFPKHTYDRSGVYNVTLTYMSEKGFMGRIQRSILIKPESSGLEDRIKNLFYFSMIIIAISVIYIKLLFNLHKKNSE